jgi:AcrR family transcriptional regulator
MAKPRLTREEKRAQTRAALFEAGAKVFVRRGYHGATLEEIAEEAGYTRGAVYSNFADKQELFGALMNESLREKAEQAHDVLAGAESAHNGTVLEALKQSPEYVQLWFEFFSHAARDPNFRERFVAGFSALRDTFTQVIERWYEEAGVEPAIPPRQLAVAVNALANGIAIEEVIDPGEVPAGLTGDVLELILRGLRAS